MTQGRLCLVMNASSLLFQEVSFLLEFFGPWPISGRAHGQARRRRPWRHINPVLSGAKPGRVGSNDNGAASCLTGRATNSEAKECPGRKVVVPGVGAAEAEAMVVAAAAARVRGVGRLAAAVAAAVAPSAAVSLPTSKT